MCTAPRATSCADSTDARFCCRMRPRSSAATLSWDVMSTEQRNSWNRLRKDDTMTSLDWAISQSVSIDWDDTWHLHLDAAADLFTWRVAHRRLQNDAVSHACRGAPHFQWFTELLLIGLHVSDVFVRTKRWTKKQEKAKHKNNTRNAHRPNVKIPTLQVKTHKYTQRVDKLW